MSAHQRPDYFDHAPPAAATPRNAWQACCGDHLGHDREALCWIDLQHGVHRYSFEQLDRWSAQFAQPLAARGVRPGQRVAGLLPRRLELLIVVLGSWRAGAVYQPLFTAFGPKSLQHRLDAGETSLLVAHRDQRGKLEQVANLPPLNDDGGISFFGRSDDVITSSGYRIGPFDVESSLIEHPDVVEAAAVGKPDPQRTEIVVAYVVLRAGVAGDDALAHALARFVKQRLSAHAYPHEVHFVDELPKTPSGKIQRFLLRQALAGAGEAAAEA